MNADRPGLEATDCPADDLLVGLVQQRLPEGVSEPIRTHIAACDDCRATAALLADEPLVADDRPVAAKRPSNPFTTPVLWMAAAACALVGLAVLLVWRAAHGPVPVDTSERLVAAARELVQADPEAFAGFRVLSADELGAPYEPDVERGGLRLATPRARILSPRPTFRWHRVAGASAYRVTVHDELGRELWSRTANEAELPYPEDAEALRPDTRYLWKVSTEAALGQLRGRQVFQVADAARARRFGEARRRIETTVDPSLVLLLEAHLAIRMDCLEYAWGVLGDGSDDDPVVRATRRYVARRLDLPAEE